MILLILLIVVVEFAIGATYPLQSFLVFVALIVVGVTVEIVKARK